MKRKSRVNLIISSVTLMGTFLIILYLLMVIPQRVDLIITFGIITLADTYFLVDGILKRLDDNAEESLEKQSELLKVGKGIYSVEKREETSMDERVNMLADLIDELREENQRLNAVLIEQEKLFTKVNMKKTQENMNKLINGNDRIAKLIIQLTSNNNTVSNETIALLNDISKSLNDQTIEEAFSNVRMMPPRAE